MSAPHRVVTVRDEAGHEIGWLVIDQLVDGLSFGGFRFSPTVTREEVEHLARCMTQKLALHGSPVGGAKAGLRCDPTGQGVHDLLDRFADAAQPGNAGVLRGVEIAVAAGHMNTRRFHDDQARAAASTRFVIGDEPVVRLQVTIKQAGHVPG